jgi:hypothetical protein
VSRRVECFFPRPSNVLRRQGMLNIPTCPWSRHQRRLIGARSYHIAASCPFLGAGENVSVVMRPVIRSFVIYSPPDLPGGPTFQRYALTGTGAFQSA